MKNIFLLLVFIGLLISCKDKQTPDTTEVKDAPKVEQPVSIPEQFEGKVVMSVSGEWYVIKDGMRWRAMSEPATTDYLNSIANGQNHVVKDVSEEILSQFPIGGEILPKLQFKPQ